MEVVLELGRGGAEVDDLVGEQVGLDGRYAVALNALHGVERAQQVDEPLARGAAEVARIDARDDDLLLARRGDLPRLLREVGYGHVAARAPGVVDGAVGAAVVAAVLHLEEGPRAVAAREGREETGQLLGLAAVHARRPLARQFGHAPVEVALEVVAQHEVHALDGGDLAGLELRVAPRHGDDGPGIAAVEFADEVAALLVGVFGDRAAVDHADVGLGVGCHADEASLLELAGEGGALGEVEFAAQSMEIYAALLHVRSFFTVVFPPGGVPAARPARRVRPY